MPLVPPTDSETAVCVAGLGVLTVLPVEVAEDNTLDKLAATPAAAS
ncbi:hypothetical protein BOKEGFJH_00001 [Chlamydia avium]|nr:hypothetical protein BOKEGFJH_00001 [Chlamydia avium]